MIFSSFQFIVVFLPAVFLLHLYLTKKNNAVLAINFLSLASIIFYAYWDWKYVPLLIANIGVNYFLGLKISNTTGKYQKRYLIFGIVFNVCLLGWFKYFVFFAENLSLLTGVDFAFEKLILPLGISFITFQQIAYLSDCRKPGGVNYKFSEYFLFITFFPQLIAGPIVHHKEMVPQYRDSKWCEIDYDLVLRGLCVFSIGFFKKVVLADTFAVWADRGYSQEGVLTTMEAWIATSSYTLQLYFDFSGYCDMAVGAAMLFKIKLPFNFDSPYKSANIQDFWRRWHISLGAFLRDYVYIPLGGSKKGSKVYVNLIITFLIGGFWHGAGWNFIVWGLLHGVALVVHRVWLKTKIRSPYFMSWLLTIFFVHIAWVFFRAKNIDQAFGVLASMFGFRGGEQVDLSSVGVEVMSWGGVFVDALSLHLTPIAAANFPAILMILAGLILALFGRNANYLRDANPTQGQVALSFALFICAALTSFAGGAQSFLYFNF